MYVLRATYAILAATLAGALFGCNVPGSTCPITEEGGDWSSYFDAQVTSPNCPVKLPQKAPLDKTFAFSVFAKQPGILRPCPACAAAPVNWEVANGLGATPWYGTEDWVVTTDDYCYLCDEAFVNGYYQAGTGWISGGPAYKDDDGRMSQQIWPCDNCAQERPYAHVLLSVDTSVYSSMSVIGSAPAYSDVTAEASASNYLAPITYAWTINGSPACGNASSCTAQLGAEGSNTTFAVTVTDAEGQWSSSSANVMAQYSECPSCMAPRRDPDPVSDSTPVRAKTRRNVKH